MHLLHIACGKAARISDNKGRYLVHCNIIILLVESYSISYCDNHGPDCQDNYRICLDNR